MPQKKKGTESEKGGSAKKKVSLSSTRKKQSPAKAVKKTKKSSKIKKTITAQKKKQHKPAMITSTDNEIKKKNEELMAANMELEAVNEELQATMEELEAANEEYQAQNNELITAQKELIESEMRFRSFTEKSPDAIFVNDLKGNIIIANEMACSSTGYSKNELHSMNIFKIDVITANKKERKKFWEELPIGENISLEGIYRRKDRSTFPVEMNQVKIILEGKPIILSFIRDITEGKKAKERILSQRDFAVALSTASTFNECLKICLEGALDITEMDCGAIYLFDKSNGELNIVYQRGLSDEFLKETSHYEPDSDNVKIVMLGEPIYTEHLKLNVQLSKSEKKEKLGALAIFPMKHMGEIIGCINIASHTIDRVSDYSRTMLEMVAAQISGSIARMQAEESLKESEVKYSTVVQKANDGISIAHDGCIVFSNEALARITGYSISELEGKAFIELMTQESAEYTMDLYNKRISGESVPSVYEITALHKDGTTRDLEISAGVIPYRDKTASIAIIRDITERKQTEELISHLAQMVDIAPNSILVHDFEGRIIYANQSTFEMHGYKKNEFMAKNLHDIDMPESERLIENRMKQIDEIGEASFEVSHFRKDGSSFPMLVDVKKIYWAGKPAMVSIGTDITERKRTERALVDREEKYRFLADNISDNIWILDIKTMKFSYQSPSVFKLLGYTDEEMMKMQLENVTEPKSMDLAIKTIVEELAMDGKEGVDPDRVKLLELEQYHKNGSTVYVEVTARLLRDEDGKPTAILGTSRDITKRKSIEQALSESEERWRSLIENTDDIIQILDVEGNIQFINKVYPPHELKDVLGKSVFEFMNDESERVTKKAIEKLLNKKSPQSFEITIILAEDKIAWFEVRYIPMFVDGKVERIISIVSDIGERKEADRKLRESEERYRVAFQTSIDSINISDLNGTLIYVNEGFLQMSGYTQEEVIGKTTIDLGIWRYPEDRKKFIEGLKKDGRVSNLEVSFVFKDGSVRTGLVSANIIMINNKAHVLSIARDITDRKQAEEALLKSEERFQMVAALTTDIIYEWDVTSGSLKWFGDFEDSLGYEAGEINRTIKDWISLMHPEDSERLSDSIDRHRTSTKPIFEIYRMRSKDGSWCWWEDKGMPVLNEDGIPVKWIGGCTDITERKRTQEIIIQTEKMMSVGGLAAGMAHEINNPLAGILQGAQVIRNRLLGDIEKNKEVAADCGLDMDILKKYMDKRDIQEIIEGIAESGKRAAKIVDNMLSFSRKSGSKFIESDLGELIDRAVELAESDYDLTKKYDFKKIEIVREYDSDAPKVLCDHNKIQQVLLNVLRNGAEAMLENKETDQRFIVRTQLEDNMVRIEIEDNGPGMSEDVRRRIFEPFYTTKSVGEGTGLGLSVSYFIITENHHGKMEVESSPGLGTKFIIKLPIGRKTS